jgi:IS30 family transposase
MACHPELARRLKIDIWFCDPHAPWQRGSDENTNGLPRASSCPIGLTCASPASVISTTSPGS